MAYKVNYAGVNLHDYLDILNVKRPLMPPRTNFIRDIPGVNGQYYMGHKYYEKEIELDCLIKAKSREEFIEICKEVSFLLDVDTPKRLVIDDDPGKYCYAVLSDSIDIERLANNSNFTIKMVCYDPLTYALDKDFFISDSKKIVNINNSGTTTALPIVQVSFGKEAHFLQCTNYRGETVLIGKPPSVEKQNGSHYPQVLLDKCQVLTNWNPVDNIVDNAIVNGSLTINGGGYGIMCNNFGSGDEWHGAGARRNFESVDDFRVEVKMEHSSKGDLKGVGASIDPPITTPPVTSPETIIKVQYLATAYPSLRIRSGRGTSYSQLGSIPQNKVIEVWDINNNWGKTNYNGVEGYVYMEHTERYYANQTQNRQTYRCTAAPSLRIRAGRGTNYKQLGSIKYNALVNVTDIQNNWGKVLYNGVSGYVSMQYMTKVSTTRNINSRADEVYDNSTAEDRLGRLEVYGFDHNGTKLFKMSMKDTSEYYEYSDPEIQIGNTVVLDDNKTVPAPKTVNVADSSDESKTVTKQIDSGRFGDWNEFVGWFTIQRKTNAGGQQEWMCKIEKLKNDGTIERAIQTNTLVSDSYPSGSLTNVVIFIGQYKQVIPVDVMNITDINITNLNHTPQSNENKPIFRPGDELMIDFSEQKVYLNGRLFMNEIDIGSQFFTVPVGNSQMICKSDDDTIDVEVGIQKRWI